MPNSKDLRIAVVGTGKVAQRNYLPGLAATADVSLGYYNRTRAKADECATKFGGQAFGSLAALMAWDPDAVLVLTREMDRYDAACALMELGPRRVFFEKPLVARAGQEQVSEQDFADARHVLQRAENRQCQTAMIFNYRFFEHVVTARRLIAERDFGQVVQVTGLVHYACWSHCIDLVHFFAGPVAQITALQSDTRRDWNAMSAQDVTAAFRTVGDATGTLIGTTALAWDFPLFEMSFSFERGRIRIQDLDGDMEVMDAQTRLSERYAIPRDRSRWDQYNSSFNQSVAAYLDSIRSGGPPPVPGVAGLLELQFEAGLKRSIATGKPVTLAEAFPLEGVG
jgi:predicted dehydrogenase